MRKLFALGVVGFFLISMYACAPTYEKPKIDLVWPVPPDKPRIKFVDIYWSSLDLGKEGGVAESLFGEEEIMKFIKPYGVAVDNENRIYITDVGRVIVFDLMKKDYSFIGIDPGQGQLRVPIGIAASSDGRLFITDIGADRVYVYREGKFAAAIGQTGEFENPTGIGLDEQRNLLYITDSKKHQVMVYSLNDYRFLRSIGKRGNAEGDFNFPTNIAIDADGNVHVVDTGNFRVQIFDTSGNFLRSIGRLGDTPGAFARPKGIAFDSKGHLYVVDAAFQNFQIFDKEGRILLFVGEAGRGPGKFMLPAGMAIDENDKIYVIDQIPGSLQIFQFLGDG
jgi:DNA-binding beta-propeller fold protein YncE